MPAGLLRAISIISSSFDTTCPLYVTVCPFRTLSPVFAVTPSIPTLPASICLSASRLEHTPASLRNLFILTPFSSIPYPLFRLLYPIYINQTAAFSTLYGSHLLCRLKHGDLQASVLLLMIVCTSVTLYCFYCPTVWRFSVLI